MLRKLISLLRPSRRELLDAAIQRASGLCGDVEAARQQSQHYWQLLQNCDPWLDWWTFAHLRQEHADAMAEHGRAYELYRSALADLEALLKVGEQ